MKTKLTLFVAVIAVALFGTGCSSVKITEEQLQNGMIAYYPFHGNAMDGSGNGLHGEVNKAILSVDRHGKPDSAYETKKDGGKILLPNDPVFNLQKHTVCGWFRLKETSEHPMLVSKQQEGKGVAFSIGGWRKNQTKGRAYSLGYEKSGIEKVLDNTVTSNLMEWNHFVGTFDGKTMSIYLNGVLSDSSVEQFQIKHFGGRVSIGTRYGVESDRYQASQVDDVRIYNRALSTEEVKALYELEKPKSK